MLSTSLREIQHGGGCQSFNRKASVWQISAAKVAASHQPSLASFCSICNRSAWPFRVQQISIARSSASRSTGESFPPACGGSAGAVGIVILQCHGFVVAHLLGALGIVRLPRLG